MFVEKSRVKQSRGKLRTVVYLNNAEVHSVEVNCENVEWIKLAQHTRMSQYRISVLTAGIKPLCSNTEDDYVRAIEV
jgi:hypothetical protein